MSVFGKRRDKCSIEYYRSLVASRPDAELKMLKETYEKLNSYGVRNKIVQNLINVELNSRGVYSV